MSQSLTQPNNMPARDSKRPNGFVSFWRKIHHSLGFKKGYNFILFFIFAGALLGFSLARLSYLNIGGKASSSFAQGSAPGEWYWDRRGKYRVGITLHLATILPAGLLIVLQFVPIIRYKALLFHRLNGYVIITLVLISHSGALIIARHSFGGGLDVQAGIGLLVIISTVAIAMAYYNIKRLQIDQHRAWMLRAMFYMGSIITLRIIMIISVLIITMIRSYWSPMTCDQIGFLPDDGVDQKTRSMFPQCAESNFTSTDTVVAVQANFNGQVEQISAAFHLSFGMALWLALFMHLVGVEIYLAMTPREGERLRQVSYEKQMERGFAHPGSAGLTSDRWGDAEPWQPQQK